MNKKITIALVGQPNVGKSMLINAISNAKLKVGNFTGVTVEKKSVLLEYEDFHIEIIDLPGLYSLSDFGEDEKVAKAFLEHEYYDLILNVVDSTNLERNLKLTAQLLELQKRMIVALNMSDEARHEGVNIDEKQLSAVLGLPCIKVSALTKEGVDKMIGRAVDSCKFAFTENKMVFSQSVEEELANIVGFFETRNFKQSQVVPIAELSYRQIALELLEGKKRAFHALHNEPIWLELHELIMDARKHLYIHADSEDIEEIFAHERLAIAKGLVAETTKFEKKKAVTLTEKLDTLLIHRYLGIPIFLFFMWGLFQLTFEIGSIPMDLIDAGFSALGEMVGAHIYSEWLHSLIVDGVIAGVGAVIMFLPNIVILFFGIALLETTGYMSRVAFMLDGFFHRFGLHGKSFIPLVTGFGCSVPAYMSARILKSERDRLLTLFIIGFMSCGAKLPIYVLFAAAFFEPSQAGNVLFFIYISGALLGLLAAKVLKKYVFKGGDEPFVMEMPKYRLPSFKLIWHTVTTKAWLYLKKAGTYILAASMIVWFASNYPKDEALESHYREQVSHAHSLEEAKNIENKFLETKLEKSYLGIIGKFTEPIFMPIGFDWKMTVALETGLAAKEVVVSTLGVLYSLGSEEAEDSSSLSQQIRKHISIPSAAAFIVFILIYLPCLAASAVFTKEAGHIKYLGWLFIFTTSTAYVLALVTYITVGLFF